MLRGTKLGGALELPSSTASSMNRTKMWAFMHEWFRGISKEKIAEPKKGADEVPGELASMNWLGLIGLELSERGQWQKQ